MKADNDGYHKGGNVQFKPLTMEIIEEACRKVRHANKQTQFLEDREAGRQDDINNNRGYLILNPEIKQDFMALVHGSIIDRDGVEYRVIVEERMRGMKNIETGENQWGWWLPPQPSALEELKTLAKLASSPPTHTPTRQMHPELVPMAIPSTAVFESSDPLYNRVMATGMVREPTDEEAAPAIAAMAKSIEKAVDAELTTEVEVALAALKEDDDG